MSGGSSVLPDDVAFDHDAAFRASWAVDEALRALEDLADGRVRLAADILCYCSGPYADALRDEVARATWEAEALAEDLRRARGQIAAARDDAFVEQARAEVRRALATSSAGGLPTDLAGAVTPEGPW
jgi:hypothetical protein